MALEIAGGVDVKNVGVEELASLDGTAVGRRMRNSIGALFRAGAGTERGIKGTDARCDTVGECRVVDSDCVCVDCRVTSAVEFLGALKIVHMLFNQGCAYGRELHQTATDLL